MKLAVLVCGDGRREYLAQSLLAIRDNVLHPINARLMINDEADPAYCAYLDTTYPEWKIVHTGRVGMAGAVQAGFDLALAHDPDCVLWVEDDMVLTRQLPLREAAQVLDERQHFAQILFKREAVPGDGADDQLQALMDRSSVPMQFSQRYVVQDYIFSLNPCLIPKRILELGYDTDNEAGMTKKLLDKGFVFGVWGHVGDEPYARHIGTTRSDQWRL